MSPPRDRLLAWLLEEAPIGLGWIDRTGTLELNAKAADLLGAPERRLDRTYWRAMTLVDEAGCRIAMADHPLVRALRGERVPRTRVQVIRPDGIRVPVDVQAVPFGDGGAVSIFEDASWLLERECNQVEWIAALGHELGGGLHGLSTAVTAATLLVEREDMRDRARHHLDIARAEIRVMVRLVRDFLDAARLGVGALEVRPATLEVPMVLAELADAAESLDPRHRVILQIEPGLRARADLDRLKQIMANLLSNAAKYSTPGLLMLGAQREGDRVLIGLTDEGPGIAVEAQAKLFQRFHRLPSKRDGSGMGLWISRELALRMGGDLWVRSAEGRPTTFCLALPAEEAECLSVGDAGNL
ncbi:MAG: HAMP domain-containing sensor histidine kinase [Myxococcaceae bacterium]